MVMLAGSGENLKLIAMGHAHAAGNKQIGERRKHAIPIGIPAQCF